MTAESVSLRLVPARSEAIRLDQYLVEAGLVRNRSRAKSLIDAERVLVDGRSRKAGHSLRGGERVEVRPDREAAADPRPEDLPLSILYEDADLVALDKPPGMVVHPAPGAWSGTVVNALLHRGLVRAESGEGRPGIVHRLDKETSGLLLVARHAACHEALSRAFQQREVRKTYLAIVLGTPGRKQGVLDWTIGRHPRMRQRMSVHSHRGRSARTDYEVLESFANLSLLRLRPTTGRTHQIRVHLAALGHPVLADPVYGSRRGRALPKSGPGTDFRRQALHAAELSFVHPTNGRSLHLIAPLPADIAELLVCLRAGSH